MARRDYLTPEVLAAVDEMDRYLASKGKIDYSKSPDYMQGNKDKEGDPFVMNDYPDLITFADLPRTKKDLEKIRPDEAIESLVYRGGSLVIGGTTKVGKSIVVSSLVMAATTGG